MPKFEYQKEPQKETGGKRRAKSRPNITRYLKKYSSQKNAATKIVSLNPGTKIVYKLNPTLGEEDDQQVKTIQKVVRHQVKSNHLKGLPIAKFDAKTMRPYFEYPDGRKEFSSDQ